MTDFHFDPQRYPAQPGCYVMKNARGRVIYVGKAKDLRRRLASYFRASLRRKRILRLVADIHDIEVILVHNEMEALVLEHNLIKRHRPRYNRALKPEDTGYAYIVLTRERLPRLLPYRKHRPTTRLARLARQATDRRLGPYLGQRVRDTLLAFVTEQFRLRTCHPVPSQACLRYDLGRCSGPCEKASASEYLDDVARAVAFLETPQHTDLVRQLRAQMEACAEGLAFERAQRIRDQVAVLERVLHRQVVERDVDHDQEVIYFGEDRVLVASIRRGVLQGLGLYDLESVGDHSDACERFLLGRYGKGAPSELILNQLESPVKIERALTAANGYEVAITRPVQGAGVELLELCEMNYGYRTLDVP